MTHGVLGIIICPMADDNLVYSLGKDPEEKDIVLIETGYEGQTASKLEKNGIPFRTVPWADVVSGAAGLDSSRFTILIHCTDLGLHSRPDVLKSTVEGIARDFQPYVDGIGFYLGTCGNYEWDIPKWCEEQGLKPGAMFTDENGCLCHDCVGINIAGGPRYKDMQKKYVAHLFVFPAMATNYEDFMEADQADAAATEASLTPEMREVLGIEPGRDGYMRWLFSLGGYEHILKLDTGIGDREEFEKGIQEVARKTGLKIREPEEQWTTLQPTDDLYAKCKSFLAQREGRPMEVDPASILVTDRAGFREWLEENHDKAKECYVPVCRTPGHEALEYLDAVEEALCFGWIDSTHIATGEHYYVQRFSPRRKGSRFTYLNRARCKRLEELGLMTKAGRRVIPKGKFVIDEDLLEIIRKDRKAKAAIKTFPELYVLVRLDNIMACRSEPELFRMRLDRFMESTRQGKMFGQWDDGGRLDHGPLFRIPRRKSAPKERLLLSSSGYYSSCAWYSSFRD